jgi:hypothetical protein
VNNELERTRKDMVVASFDLCVERLREFINISVRIATLSAQI